MQIIIPMSGFGERFRRAGYQTPKFLIEVEGKPIIEHVVGLFPGTTDILFICNEEDLANTQWDLEKRLLDIVPMANVVGIKPHKLGPVHTVLSASEQIKAGPCMVSYCDFCCCWDFETFQRDVKLLGCDGAVVAYKNFHPHSVHGNYYAFIQEKDGNLLDIREKSPFTDDPMSEYASCGLYYFANGSVMCRYFEALMHSGQTVNGEYYISMVYPLMVRDGLSVVVSHIEYFMQWGTPDDLEEYRYFSNMFRSVEALVPIAHLPGTVLMPAAGEGSRFTNLGYPPKPTLLVGGEPMFLRAMQALSGDADHYHGVFSTATLPNMQLIQSIEHKVPNITTTWLDHKTEGQAMTCLAAMNDISMDEPLTITACDHAMLYCADQLSILLANESVDVIVWVVRGYPNAAKFPTMYGWVAMDEQDSICSVSVKQPLTDPKRDPIIIGTFTFRKASDFVHSAERLCARDGRVNGEFYVDSLIQDALDLGLTCRAFEIDYYLCWGTPNDYHTYEYWQTCFDQWDTHPYQKAKDRLWLPINGPQEVVNV